jgi:hypothetical protein
MKQIVCLFLLFSGFGKIVAQDTALSKTVEGSIAAPEKKDTDLKKAKPAASIYPNPAKNKAEISVTGFEPGFIQLQVIDLKGNRVRDDKRLLLSGSETIVLMFAMPPGIYFVSLKQDNKFIRKKLLVQ